RASRARTAPELFAAKAGARSLNDGTPFTRGAFGFSVRSQAIAVPTAAATSTTPRLERLVMRIAVSLKKMESECERVETLPSSLGFVHHQNRPVNVRHDQC